MGDVSNSDADTAPEYKVCCLYNGPHGPCGPYMKFREPRTGVVSVMDLDADTTIHFKNLKLKDLKLKDKTILKWSERELIENRVKHHLDDQAKICERHRNTQGVNWRQTEWCLHEHHDEYQRGKKGCPTKLASQTLVKEMNDRKPYSFVIGGKICIKHIREESGKPNPEPEPDPEPESDPEPEPDPGPAVLDDWSKQVMSMCQMKCMYRSRFELLHPELVTS